MDSRNFQELVIICGLAHTHTHNTPHRAAPTAEHSGANVVAVCHGEDMMSGG